MSDRAPYAPARWLPGAHAMTVFASVARVFPRPQARRERWELPDGDFVDVDRFAPPVSPPVPDTAAPVPDTAPRVPDTLANPAQPLAVPALSGVPDTRLPVRDVRGTPVPDTRRTPVPDTWGTPVPTPVPDTRGTPVLDTRRTPVPDTRRTPVPDTRGTPVPDTRGTPVLVICHGLEGSSRAPYVRGLVALALARGLEALALNFRGCSGEPNRLARNYHSGETGDLAEVVRRLVAERRGRPIVLAGFSLGGNVVAKWLGERGDDLPPEVRGGAVISVPFDLERSARAIDGPGFWAYVYRERFMRRLRAKAAEKARRFPGAFDAAAAARARTFAEFDAVVTAPVFGFASAEEYWRLSSSGPLLGGVRRPLLALSSLDDPIVPAETIPVEAARANPHVTLETTAAGGHVAFVAGAPFWPSFWAERRAADFLAALARS